MKKIFLRIGLALFDLVVQLKSDLKVAVAGNKRYLNRRRPPATS